LGKKTKNDLLQTHLSQMPKTLHKYVTGFFDPLSDGNCGFFCISKAIAYGDDGWLRVWHEMVEEITKNFSSYSPLQGGD
jgi:hypothetical protein